MNFRCSLLEGVASHIPCQLPNLFLQLYKQYLNQHIWKEIWKKKPSYFSFVVFLEAGDTFKGFTSLHAHIHRLQWEHLPNERASLNSRGTIALIYCTQPPLRIVCLYWITPLLPRLNLRFLLTSPLSLSLAKSGGLYIVFEFCCAFVKLTEWVALIGIHPIFWLQTYTQQYYMQ